MGGWCLCLDLNRAARLERKRSANVKTTSAQWQKTNTPPEPCRAGRERCACCVGISLSFLRRTNFRHEIQNFGGDLLHVQDDGVDAADQIIIASVTRDRDGQAERSADEPFPNAFGKLANVRVEPGLLEAGEDADVAENCPEEPH